MPLRNGFRMALLEEGFGSERKKEKKGKSFERTERKMNGRKKFNEKI